MAWTIEVQELEYHDETSNSHKFYRTWCVNTGQTYYMVQQWGRIGTQGQFKTVEYTTANQATTVADNVIYKKRVKGYEPSAHETFHDHPTPRGGVPPHLWWVQQLDQMWARNKSAVTRYTGTVEWVPKFIINEEIDLADHLAKKARQKVIA